MTDSAWAVVRVRKSTLAELDALRGRILLAYQRGLLRDGEAADAAGLADEHHDGRSRFSVDATISRLLAQHRRHGERRRRQAARRREFETCRERNVTSPILGATSGSEGTAG